ncbi:MAG: 4-hydroxy-tetrahydrodipicolinate synthase [Clostridiales bacterium]|nr:4-hydroxy-tetrahydrodipicolinate synthase [Clostridiales bacterium]
MAIFTGIGAAMVTPFGADGNIDYTVLEKYINHLLDGGVTALLPFGTTGEPATVTPEEYKQGLKFIIEKIGGKVPVIAGAGSNSTALACEHARLAKELGADAVLVVTPYYNKCTQRGIVEHYKAIAKVGIPVIAYNVPSRTGVNILPETLRELTKIDRVIGIKEASGDIEHIQETAKVCAEEYFPMYCGDDGLTTVYAALGCKGVISVAANPAPRQMVELYELCEKNDYAKARALQFKLNEFVHALFCEVNPIPVKKAMQLIGIDVGAPRLPLTDMEQQHVERLGKAMKEIGLV